MAQKWANNAFSTLGGAVDDLDTSITVATDTGDRFPTAEGDEFFNVTLQNAGGDVEIVKVISRDIGSDQMTVVRGQEATVPLSWSIGDIVELRPTAASFENLSQAKNITYDNASGGVAENVQDAIEEVKQELDSLDLSADAISYDDANVSFEASNVQDAVDANAAAIKKINENSYVVQTVTADTDTTVSLSTGTFTDIGLSASITPKFSDSKILIMASISMNQRRDNDSVQARVQLLKNGSSVMSLTNQDDRSTGDVRNFEFPIPFYYDEVIGSTDELAFTFQGNCGKTSNSGRVDFNRDRSTLVIMEVKQ